MATIINVGGGSGKFDLETVYQGGQGTASSINNFTVSNLEVGKKYLISFGGGARTMKLTPASASFEVIKELPFTYTGSGTCSYLIYGIAKATSVRVSMSANGSGLGWSVYKLL